MCDPLTAGTILGGAQMLSGVQEGRAQADAANYSAGVGDNNAVIADAAGAHAILTGNIQAGRARMETTRTIGKQTTGFAASGVDVSGGGSVADVQSSTRAIGELDARTIAYNASLESWKYQTQAQNFREQAALDRIKAKNAQQSGLITGVTRGAASFYGAARRY